MDKEKQKQAITEIMNEDAENGLYKQQTAVEWLKQKLLLSTKPIYNSEIEKYFEQAKQMHQKQVEEGYRVGFYDGQYTSRGIPKNYANREDYYTQTYGE